MSTSVLVPSKIPQKTEKIRDTARFLLTLLTYGWYLGKLLAYTPSLGFIMGMITCVVCGKVFSRRSDAFDQYFCGWRCRSKEKRRVYMLRHMRGLRGQPVGPDFLELYPGLKGKMIYPGTKQSKEGSDGVDQHI